MFTGIKRLAVTAVILTLCATNLLTLTHAAFNRALSGLASSYLGVRTVTGALHEKLAARDTTIRKHKHSAITRKAATRKFGARLASRTRRVVGKSIAAIPAEAVPFLGVAVLVADTGYEVYAACETLRDLDELYTALEITDARTDDALSSACHPRLPRSDQVWDGVVDKVDDWWERLAEAV